MHGTGNLRSILIKKKTTENKDTCVVVKLQKSNKIYTLSMTRAFKYYRHFTLKHL